MPKPNKSLAGLVALTMLFTACKKEMYKDRPYISNEVDGYPSVIVNSNNQILYAINPQTGKKNWELGLPTPTATPSAAFMPSPLLYKGRLYIATGNDQNDTLYKVNPRTGAIISKIDVVPNGSSTIQATPIGDGNLVYVAAYNGTLYAIDTATGATKWTFKADGPLVSSPTISGSQVYFASTAGTIYAIDKTTGSYTTGAPYTTWSVTIPGASFYSSPAVGSPYLYIGSSTDNNMYCIYLNNSTSTAAIRWVYKTGGAIFSSPAAFAGTVIFGSNDFKVYCLDTFLGGGGTPGVRWTFTCSSEVTASPFVSGQTVYVASKDYRTYALPMAGPGKNKALWSHQSNGMIKSSPICYHGIVYVGSYDKVLYALDSAKGTLMWSYPVNGQILSSPVIDDLSGTTSYNSGISGLSTFGAR